jgi:hypothetical protein
MCFGGCGHDGGIEGVVCEEEGDTGMGRLSNLALVEEGDVVAVQQKAKRIPKSDPSSFVEDSSNVL